MKLLTQASAGMFTAIPTGPAAGAPRTRTSPVPSRWALCARARGLSLLVAAECLAQLPRGMFHRTEAGLRGLSLEFAVLGEPVPQRDEPHVAGEGSGSEISPAAERARGELPGEVRCARMTDGIPWLREEQGR